MQLLSFTIPVLCSDFCSVVLLVLLGIQNIFSHVYLTMCILLLFKYFSSWIGYLLHFQGCMLFSRKYYTCWSIYSVVWDSSWILKSSSCDTDTTILYKDTTTFYYLILCNFCSSASFNCTECFKSQNVHLDMWSLPTLIIV